jgi:opacity protein-like surface antigen
MLQNMNQNLFLNNLNQRNTASMRNQTNTLLFLITTLLSTLVFSGTVTQVKNNKVLVDFNNETVNVGDQFFILSADQKKIAIIQITIAKNNKAIANITKGTPVVGGTTLLRNNGTNQMASSHQNEPSFLRYDLLQMGVVFKIMSDSVSAKVQDSGPPITPFPNQETVNMAGTNFGLGFILDYPVLDWLRAHGLISIEQYSVSATSKFLSCNGKTSTDCNAKITYLGLQGIARYDITKSKFNFWAGLGGTMKFPLSKKSTALDVDGLKDADSFTIAGGLDYHLNNKSFIPASFEYHISQNQSDQVPSINQMSLLVGYGMKF